MLIIVPGFRTKRDTGQSQKIYSPISDLISQLCHNAITVFIIYIIIDIIILLLFFFILSNFNELSLSNGIPLFPLLSLYSKPLSVHD